MAKESYDLPIMLDCPICDGTAKLTTDEDKMFVYKGISVYVDDKFYLCDACGTDFSTTDSYSVTWQNVLEAHKIFKDFNEQSKG